MREIKRTLTSREAARLLGASEASVKRWADAGLLPAERTAGGHRRFRPEAVALFRRGLGGNDGAGAPEAARSREAHESAGDKALADRLFDSLTRGEGEDVSSLLVNAYLHGRRAATIVDSLLCPALRRIGEHWYWGRLSVAQEHVASRAAAAAVRAMGTAAEPAAPSGGRAICCAVEDDFHSLPVEMSGLVLACEGWEVVNLGVHTPFHVLTEAVARYHPRLVCIAATVLFNLELMTREYEGFRAEARRAKVTVVLGGGAFAGDEVRRRFPADLLANTFEELSGFARALGSVP